MIGPTERKRIKSRVKRIELDAENRFDTLGSVVQCGHNSLGGTQGKEDSARSN